METERDRITKALEVLDDIDHNNRMLNYQIHLERISRFHDLLPPEILIEALAMYVEIRDGLERAPLADVPALVSKQAA